MPATTNRPEHVDQVLRRPARFDQVVWMGLPDERGRADVFEHYLRGLKLVPPLRYLGPLGRIVSMNNSVVDRLSERRVEFPIPLQFPACCKCTNNSLQCPDSQLRGRFVDRRVSDSFSIPNNRHRASTIFCHSVLV